MNRNLLLTTGCTLSLLLCSCNGQKGARSVEEITASLHIEEPDTSLYGTLQAVALDSLKFTSDYDSEPFSCAYDAAQSQHSLFGSLTPGNRYAVHLSSGERTAATILNITELSGQWFYDDAPESGLTFAASGALSSINAKDVSFKKWKFLNGQIVIFYTGLEDVAKDFHDYKSDTTEIVSLSADALTLRFLGQSRSCHRQKEAIKVKFNF